MGPEMSRISAENRLTSKPNLGTTHSLNCPKDTKNGFFGKFYIDIVNRNFSQLFFSTEKIFFESEKKSVYRNFFGNVKGNIFSTKSLPKKIYKHFFFRFKKKSVEKKS